MKTFTYIDSPATTVIFTNSVELNLVTLDRLFHRSDLSYRRICEILGVSEIEMEDKLENLREIGAIK